MIRPAPRSAVLKMDDWFVWGGSMVRSADGTCHLLFSRWPRELGMRGWVTHSQIARASADDPLGPYEFQSVALEARGGEYWDGHVTHNPNVRKFGDKYYLYYNGNRGHAGKNELRRKSRQEWWTHRNNQRVGVAVAEDPAGPWQRFDEPLLDVGPWKWNGLITTNPSVARNDAGDYLLVYKTVATAPAEDMPFGGKVTHGVASSSSPTGPFEKHPEPVFTHPTASFPAEDPYVRFMRERYWAIVKDQEGYFVESETQQLVLFQSQDGLDWELAEHPLVTKPRIRWADGEVQEVSRLERPQLFVAEGVPRVLFVAVRPSKGRSFNVHIPLREA